MIRSSWMLATVLPVALFVLVMCREGSAANPEVFALADTPGEHMDVTVGGRVVARYVYAYDTSTPERTHDTYKPFLHVFDAEGRSPITKGPGGEFTHHRGIFIGWNKIGHAGKEYDRWHMKTGAIVHRAFAPTSQKEDADGAMFTSVTEWNDDTGEPLLREERTMTFSRGPTRARLVVTLIAKLEAVKDGEVTLDGDPEHAGIHYRPADTLVRADTVYLYPKENAKPHEDLDYPWVGMTYTLGGGGEGGGKRHSVVQMSHPDNPPGTRWSAYRNYGRFGAFPRATVKPGEPLTFRYRFLIADGEMPGPEVIQKDWDTFAGRKDASAVPTITVLPAEQPEPKVDAGSKGSGAIASAATKPTTRPKAGHPTNPGPEDAPILFDVPTPEPLDVEEALKTFTLPDGFRIEPVATEPMVEDPVADLVRALAERLDARLAWPFKPGVPPPVVVPLKPEQHARFEHGREVFANACAACHQPSGLGMDGLAPPLVDSEWVHGPPARLARVVLHGLTGPITVNGAQRR